jgi:alcohol dehydrogenase (cytochrome c)
MTARLLNHNDNMKIRKLLTLTGVALVLAILAGVFLIWRSDQLRWRGQVVWMAAMGQVPDLSLMDALRMARPGSGYWLEDLPERRNAYATIKNPFETAADVEAGAATFKTYCAGCHGADARGGTGPALVNRNLKHGDSDWAMLRTVRDGVSGTSMPPHADWDYKRMWQAISYVRSKDTAHANTDEAAPSLSAKIDVPYEELKSVKEPGADWLLYGGAYSSVRHSSLTQVNRDNVTRLAPLWVHQFHRLGDRIQTTPLVRDGVMYVTHATSVIALDARDGSQIWEFNRPLPPDALSCCGITNRGATILGDRIFVGTIDAKLVALSARTGKKLWEVAVAPDYAHGVSITSAPLAFGDTVVTGAGGGDYPTRGFLAAFDAATGKPRWRFDTIPGPNQPGHETWPNNDAWRTGGGSTWITGSYDPEQDIVYWGTGNPAPNHNAATRKGDNLYTNSVIALRGKTGEKLWYFQFTPNDDHDWDSVQTPILVDRPQGDAPRQLIWANRNGFFYALDRDTGKFLHGAPFVKQNWAKGLDAKGRPERIPESSPSPSGTLVWPGVQGGTNWWSPSYDPSLDLMFVPALEHAGLYYSTNRSKPETGQLFLSGYTEAAPGVHHEQQVVAIRASDGTVVWRHHGAPSLDDDLHLGGLCSTAGGLVFAADDRTFFALDARDGRTLWQFPTGARIAASPMTFMVDGKQVVAIASGRDLFAFGLVGATGDTGPALSTAAARH